MNSLAWVSLLQALKVLAARANMQLCNIGNHFIALILFPWVPFLTSNNVTENTVNHLIK